MPNKIMQFLELLGGRNNPKSSFAGYTDRANAQEWEKQNAEVLRGSNTQAIAGLSVDPTNPYMGKRVQEALAARSTAEQPDWYRSQTERNRAEIPLTKAQTRHWDASADMSGFDLGQKKDAASLFAQRFPYMPSFLAQKQTQELEKGGADIDATRAGVPLRVAQANLADAQRTGLQQNQERIRQIDDFLANKYGQGYTPETLQLGSEVDYRQALIDDMANRHRLTLSQDAQRQAGQAALSKLISPGSDFGPSVGDAVNFITGREDRTQRGTQYQETLKAQRDNVERNSWLDVAKLLTEQTSLLPLGSPERKQGELKIQRIIEKALGIQPDFFPPAPKDPQIEALEEAVRKAKGKGKTPTKTPEAEGVKKPVIIPSDVRPPDKVFGPNRVWVSGKGATSAQLRERRISALKEELFKLEKENKSFNRHEYSRVYDELVKLINQ